MQTNNEVIVKHIGKDLRVLSNGEFFYKNKKRKLKTQTTRMKNGKTTNLLCVIILYKPKRVVRSAAKIIATLFVDNPNDYKFVSYKDGDFKNIDYSNLMWSKCAAKTFRRPKNTGVKLNETNLTESVTAAISNENVKMLMKAMGPFVSHRVPNYFYKSYLFDLVKSINTDGRGLVKGMNDKMLTRYINKTVKFRHLDYQKQTGIDYDRVTYKHLPSERYSD